MALAAAHSAGIIHRDLKLTLENLGRPLSPPGRGTSFASIAVLPFINMNPDEENEFLSDGITEDIMSALMRVEGLRVAARRSVFQFKGKARRCPRSGGG